MEENLHIDQHISHKYNEELEAVRGKVLVMGGLVEQQCVDALQALLKGDSDLAGKVASSDREINDLERIGDEAEKIGRLALKLVEGHDRETFYTEPRHLGEGVITMLHDALDAFARLDVGAAIELAGRDPELDREFESLTRLLISHMMEEPQKVKNMLRVNWCCRALERIGDHAVNICEEVVYLVKGDDVRHLPYEQILSLYGE